MEHYYDCTILQSKEKKRIKNNILYVSTPYKTMSGCNLALLLNGVIFLCMLRFFLIDRDLHLPSPHSLE